MSLRELREKVQTYLYEYDLASRSVDRLARLVDSTSKDLEQSSEIQLACQSFAADFQSKIHSQISTVVSDCLNTVFEEDAYEFEIVFEQRRGKTEAQLVFKRDGLVLDEPLNASGGGAVDVAAFALRLAALMLTRPRKRRVLILDEPFRFVSREYWPRLVLLLEMISRKLDFQFIIVTHVDELKIGSVVEL